MKPGETPHEIAKAIGAEYGWPPGVYSKIAAALKSYGDRRGEEESAKALEPLRAALGAFLEWGGYSRPWEKVRERVEYRMATCDIESDGDLPVVLGDVPPLLADFIVAAYRLAGAPSRGREGDEMTTPEGPAATRCEICGRIAGTPASVLQEDQCWKHLEAYDREECYRLGYELARARLVEVERERDEALVWSKRLADSGREECKARIAAESRALAAEARLSEVEGALRDLRGFANVMWERSREKFHARIDAALSGSPSISEPKP